MRRRLPPALLLIAAALSAGDWPEGTLRQEADARQIEAWLRDFTRKRPLIPDPPAPGPSSRQAEDFSGTYRFGSYGFDLTILQEGDRVAFRCGGVDRQDIGGAFDTLGCGLVRDGRIYARWWCLDLTRNLANNGGAELWFVDAAREVLRARYYHDSDETIEEGYGVRAGRLPGETPPYRIRIPQPVVESEQGVPLRGTVRGREGEILRDAVVMLRHEEASVVRTDEQGAFALLVKRIPAVFMVSAAAPGYRTAVQALLLQERRDLDFVLDPSPATDDPRYRFVDPVPDKGSEIWRCGNCHRNSYVEWASSRHAMAARNAVTRALYQRDFLPALASGAARGDAGLCAACHAPEAALADPAARLDRVTGTALRGNHCDLCHKVHHVEDTGAPGVRGSLVVARPPAEDPAVPGPIRRVYGALADSDYLFMGAVYNPLFATSVLCAGCHQYDAGGLPALDTYGEWLAWAIGKRSPETCQGCHMEPGISKEGRELAERICVNGLRRPGDQIHHHGFVGREKAPGAIALHVATKIEGEALRVAAEVCNVGAGHKAPTGSGDKHLLLVVLAADALGRPFPLVTGSRVPAHAGGGEPPSEATALRLRREAHEFGLFPGREFAQVLADAGGNTHVPFWRAARVVEDTRLDPGVPVSGEYVFSVPGEGAVNVRVELWHRLRPMRDDAARDVKGDGVRPLDLLVAREVRVAR